MATLETHHCAGAVGEQIHHLAFAFVAPLGTNDYDILTHLYPFSRPRAACHRHGSVVVL